MVKVIDYLDPDLVLFFDAHSREEVLESLLHVVEKRELVDDIDAFRKAINERESVVSTGIGMGAAIPHAKLPELNHFFVLIGVLDGGVEWNSVDGSLVRTIFMIGGPDDKQTEYLQILSGLTLALKDNDRRKRILNAKSQEEIVELFEGF